MDIKSLLFYWSVGVCDSGTFNFYAGNGHLSSSRKLSVSTCLPIGSLVCFLFSLLNRPNVIYVYYGEDISRFIVASYFYMVRYPDEFANRVAFLYDFFMKIRLIISLFDSEFSIAIIALSKYYGFW